MYLPAPQPFCLDAGWLNAQAFRWKEKDGWLHGIVGGALIKVRNADGGIEYEGNADKDAVKRYFRLDQEIGDVHAALCEADPNHMPGLVEKYGYIRVLRQDPWECLVAYICSAIASVESIRGKLNKLADCCGDTLTLADTVCRSVPSAGQLKDAGVDKLRDLGLGLPHIPVTLDAVATDVAGGKLNLDDLSRKPLTEARERLREYDGIGPKIADCVCLFSLGHDEAFPVDTHIGAALEKRYGLGGTLTSKGKWAAETFGPNAGYAGQLLFLDQLH